MTVGDVSPYPEFFRLRQQFESHAVEDIASAVESTLTSVLGATDIRSGQTVAIAVGSRGIANLQHIVSAVVKYVQSLHAVPIVVPAMGSHGGATAEGQAAVLASYGVTSAGVGCPIKSSMDTVLVGTTADGVDVHFDRTASEADHIIVVNRVKPHTRLSGQYESGILKMMMIGLGKHQGAYLYHQMFPSYGYRLDALAPDIVSMILESMPVTAGLAIVEDAFENTSLIEAIAARDILDREPQLLELARERLPGLPFQEADLLIVDRIGKEISGTGMDTNVIGRKTNDKCAAPEEWPKMRQIYVRSLTEKTSGNACGIGVAEYCHQRVVDAMDPEVTRINCITSAHVTAGAVPVTFASDKEVLDAVISQTRVDRRTDLNWIWIRDTLQISEVACSRSYWERARERADLEPLDEPRSLSFDVHGNLIDL
ncbi:MAG: lactate racemase domain-containing protein [Rubripirellula sp.]